MATPAAILSILVQARGIQKTSGELEKLNASAKKANVGLEAIEKQNKRTADSTTDLNSRFSKLDNTVGDFNRSMTGAGNVVKLVKFPALIAGAGMAAQAVGSLAAGGVALGSALAPLAGAGLAAAAGYVALGQAAGVAKLATAGLDKALSGNKKALAALTPAQRSFVDSLKEAQREVKGLKQTAAAGLLPGLDAALKTVTPLLGRLRPIIAGTAEEMGGLAVQAAKTVRSWGPDLTTVGKTNIKVIGNLGKAAIIAADGARHLVVVAGPLLVWLSKLAVVGAEWARSQIVAGRESGKLAGFLEKTRAVMTTLGHIAGNLAVAIFNIGKAAAPLGRDLLGSIEKLTERFKDWTQSLRGQVALRQYFRDARQPIMEVAGLIGDLGAAFLRISQGTGATGLIVQLRSLVPILENVITSTTAAFGPALIDALGNVLRLFGLIAGSSGPLVQLVRLIGLIAGGLADMLQASPALNSMTVSFIGLYGSAKALALVMAPLAAMTTVLQVGLIGDAAAAASAGVANLGLRVSLLATAAAMYAQATAAKVAAVGQWLLNAAVLAFPVVAIVAAMAAVVVGLIYAYNHVETFRNIVDDTFSWIKDHWPLLLAILTGPLGLAVLAIVKHASDIKNAVVGAFTAMVNAVKALSGTIVGLGSWTINRIVDGMKATTGGLLTVGGWIKNRVMDGFTAVVDSVQAIGGWVINRVVEGVKNTADNVASIGGWLKNRILDGLTAVKDGVMGLGGTIIGWIVDGLKAGANKLVDFLNDIIGVINKLPGVEIGKLKGFAEGGKNAAIPPNKMARGGAYARTGGVVGAPIVMMGEEAPRYPEYVIPTNPAYRGRAVGLLSQAAAAIGMATGGTYSHSDLEKLWVSAGGASGKANIMAAIAQAESGGDPNVRNPSGASGLWQILGQVIGGNIFDPVINARNAIAKSNNGVTLSPWVVYQTGAYKQFLSGGGGGLLGAIGDLLGGGLDALLGKLPGAGDLPDWLKGTGKYILDKVTGWIKDKVGGLFAGSGAQGGFPGKGGKFPAGPHAQDLLNAVGLAQRDGLTITATTNGQHAANSWHYAGRAFDASNGTNTPQEMKFAQQMLGLAPMLLELFYDPMGRYVKNGQIIPGAIGGHSDHVHVAMRKGGVWPYVGAFGNGGVVSQTGMAFVHRGETIAPVGGATVVHEHHYHGPVVQDKDFLTYMRNLDKSYGRQNGRTAFGG
jgi:hypothetical protein